MIKERTSSFIWDWRKEQLNIQKHGVDFHTAALAFKDPHRRIFIDSKHSRTEERYFLYWKSGRENFNGALCLS